MNQKKIKMNNDCVFISACNYQGVENCIKKCKNFISKKEVNNGEQDSKETLGA